MDPFDIKAALKTFRIIVDTREQNTPTASERFGAFGVPVERATLAYGDYCGQVTLPDGSTLYDTTKTIKPLCAVERKMSLDELAMCFTRDRQRFRREFERATASRAKMWLLVENGSWEAVNGHRYRSRFHESALRASLIAWCIRYDINHEFCRSETSGSLIKEILYRDIKERLEGGAFG